MFFHPNSCGMNFTPQELTCVNFVPQGSFFTLLNFFIEFILSGGVKMPQAGVKIMFINMLLTFIGLTPT